MNRRLGAKFCKTVLNIAQAVIALVHRDKASISQVASKLLLRDICRTTSVEDDRGDKYRGEEIGHMYTVEIELENFLMEHLPKLVARSLKALSFGLAVTLFE